MPCRDWGSDGVQYVENPVNEKMKKRLDITTKLLCGVMTALAKRGMTGDLVATVPGLGTWWKDHQEEDRKAEQRARDERESKRRSLEAEISSLNKKLKEL